MQPQLQNPRGYPPKTTFLHSTIPPKNSRELRKHVEFKSQPSPVTENIPILNQMLSFKPNLAPMHSERFSSTSRTIENAIEKKTAQLKSTQEHERREFFFNSIVSPPDSLEIPETPIFSNEDSISSFSMHREFKPAQLSCSLFSCQEIQSDNFSKAQTEDKPVHMRLVILNSSNINS